MKKKKREKKNENDEWFCVGVYTRRINQHLYKDCSISLQQPNRIEYFYSINWYGGRRLNSNKSSHYVRLCHQHKIYHVFHLFHHIPSGVEEKKMPFLLLGGRRRRRRRRRWWMGDDKLILFLSSKCGNSIRSSAIELFVKKSFFIWRVYDVIVIAIRHATLFPINRQCLRFRYGNFVGLFVFIYFSFFFDRKKIGFRWR